MNITQLLEPYNLFTESELRKIDKVFVAITFDENAILLQKGEISDKIFYISEGIIREYSDIESELEADSTFTYWILGEGDWAFQVGSYINEQPSEYYIQALTPLKAYYVKKSDLFTLMHEKPKLGIVLSKIYEFFLVQMKIRDAYHRIKSAEKRLELFEKTQPNLSNRIEGKILASYLNISPEQLRCVKKKRAKKE